MYVRMARYRTSSDPRELVKRAEEGMLPIYEQQPGFHAYSVAAAGNEIYSFSVWETEEAAETANALAAEWVGDNLAEEIELIEATTGELLLSTTLGVTA